MAERIRQALDTAGHCKLVEAGAVEKATRTRWRDRRNRVLLATDDGSVVVSRQGIRLMPLQSPERT
jgi:hypothetical protein